MFLLFKHLLLQIMLKKLVTSYKPPILPKKTIIALRAAGYSPDSTIGYLVESPTNQIMTIHLHSIDKIDKSTESEIQYIVNRIAKNNNLHNFIVNVQLVDVSLQ